VLAPAINLSRAETFPERDAIRLGLSQVRGLGGSWFDRRDDPTKTTIPQLLVAERKNGPYRSLSELITRTRIDRSTAEALIRSGTLDEFGLDRRELLWQLGLLVQGSHAQDAGIEPVQAIEDAAVGWPRKPRSRRSRKGVNAYQAPLPLSTKQDMVELPELGDWQQLAWDYETMGVTGGKHPMALIRPLLHEGLVTSLHIGGPHNPNRLPQDMVVEMAGMVVTRQKPQTASGVMFMLLEDEFGLTNLVVYTPVQERQRELVRGTAFVIVRGKIDNEKSGFPNIIAEHFRPCPLPGHIAAPESHDFG
jgi:error-prone DNA polymerase